MESIERFAELMNETSVNRWRERVTRLSNDLGYERIMLAIVPERSVPIEIGHAFVHSNYAAEWIIKYDEEKMGNIDPTVAHSISKSIPLVWSPGIFSSHRQKAMYEEACGYGIRSGVTLPIHGVDGEVGLICFVNNLKADKNFECEAKRNIPKLSCLRDFIFESSQKFIREMDDDQKTIFLTSRELECLKWGATGKSSWHIGQILNCTEATVNYHFKNIRRKFRTSTRQQALVKAMRMGIVTPV